MKIKEPLEGIQIGERIIQVTAKKAFEIRQMIAARRGKDIRNAVLETRFQDHLRRTWSSI